MKQGRGPLERQARAWLLESRRTITRLERMLARPLAEAAEAMIASLSSGGTAFFCGNGGSAADAQHLAAELAGRFMIERPPLPAVALTTNSSSVTAIGNDYGFEHAFSRQLEGLGSPGDVLVALTTSGNSPNVRRAVETAQGLGMAVIGMTGRKGMAFARMCDVALVTPSESTPHVQEGHAILGHALCDLVERALFPVPRPSRRGVRRTRGARRT